MSFWSFIGGYIMFDWLKGIVGGKKYAAPSTGMHQHVNQAVQDQLWMQSDKRISDRQNRIDVREDRIAQLEEQLSLISDEDSDEFMTIEDEISDLQDEIDELEDDIDGIEDDLDLLEDDIYDDFGISDSFDPFINDPDFYDD